MLDNNQPQPNTFGQDLKQTQFDVSPVPAHNHDGVSSDQIQFLNLADSPNPPTYKNHAGQLLTVLTTENGLTYTGSGTSGQVLTSNGVGVLPTFNTLNTNVTVTQGTTTRSSTAASGSQTIAHGLGSVPSYIRLTTTWGNLGGNLVHCTGSYNGTTQSVVILKGDNNKQGQVISSIIAKVEQEVGGDQSAVASVDATNITLTWTKNSFDLAGGNPLNMLWEAFR